MSLYLGTTLIAPNQPNSANQSLGNLNSSGQAKIDGQWVDSRLNPVSGATAPTTDDITVDLSTYLPNDGYNYEVLLNAMGTTGSTSGNANNIYISTDIITGTVRVCRCLTRASSSTTSAGSAIVPVGSGRYITVNAVSNNTGTINLYLNGYRRIGTNS